MDARPVTAASRPARNRLQLLAASYEAGARILRATPTGWRHAAAAPGGAAWFWLSRAQRQAALDNYAAALGRDRSDPDVARVARRAFQNYGRMLTDSVLMGSLAPADPMARVPAHGLQPLDPASARGPGAVMPVPPTAPRDPA